LPIRRTEIGWRVLVLSTADDISYRAVTDDWYDVKPGWSGIVLQQHSMPQHRREGNPGLGCAAYLIYGSGWNKPAGSRLFRGKSPTQNNG
jgi:hypothetical protein